MVCLIHWRRKVWPEVVLIHALVTSTSKKKNAMSI